MKKQLRIWKNDLARYWDKTSLMGRVALGGTIAFIMAFICLKTINNPIMKELKELKKNAPSEYVASIDEDQEIKDYKYELEDKRKSLLKWTEKLKKTIEEKKHLEKEMEVKIISAFDALAAEKCLSLIVRDDVNAEEKNEKTKGEKGKKQEEKEPEITGEIHHRYELEGAFSNIKSFLTEAGEMPYFFEIKEISIKRLQFENRSETSRRSGSLQLKFKVTILYLKDRV
jgi:hypothetical protein